MSSYVKYKQHTSTVITWLVECSRGLGYRDQTGLPTQPPVVGTGRKKGAARKKERAAALVTVQQNYLITIKEILARAAFIAKQNVVTAMPAEIKRSLRDSIAGRKDYAIRYGMPDDEYDGHTHFIRVLEKLTQILSPCIRIVRKTAADASDAPNAQEPISNIFEALQLEDLDSDFENDEQSNVPSPKPASTTQYEPEIDPKEEYWFRLSCFLDD
ncbi:hypothetical protein K491DRAFT_638833, partial [Lophiostoma macrostomum CBS 122681]